MEQDALFGFHYKKSAQNEFYKNSELALNTIHCHLFMKEPSSESLFHSVCPQCLDFTIHPLPRDKTEQRATVITGSRQRLFQSKTVMLV
jgi:hypothetical protein